MYKTKNIVIPGSWVHGKYKNNLFVYEVDDNLCAPNFFPGDVVLIEEIDKPEKNMKHAVVAICGDLQLVNLQYDKETQGYIFDYKPTEEAEESFVVRCTENNIKGAVRYLIRNFENESAEEVENDAE